MIQYPLWLERDAALREILLGRSERWLVTGAAGFIGSHLLRALLLCGQQVRALDNYATGFRCNLSDVRALVGKEAWARCEVVEADIRDRDAVRAAAAGITYVLHQAALGSVPRSLVDPLTTHDVNSTGFINMLDAARHAGVARFVYAASSSTYGDEPNLPKIEERIGNPLSPYALTKRENELCADVYGRSYGVATIGLRYFNVFGPRQDPSGAYAAVIPRWVAAMLANEPVIINGDGETSRDFCYVENAVQANVRAALASTETTAGVFNVAVGERTTLNDLFAALRDGLAKHGVHYDREPEHAAFRAGDVRHSLADIGKAERLLGYRPTHRLIDGLVDALPWYRERLG